MSENCVSYKVDKFDQYTMFLVKDWDTFCACMRLLRK